MWFWIWRPAVAASDASEKNCNIGVQLQSLRCTIAPKIFWKIYFLWLLVCTTLFIPSHFWTNCTKFDTCCQRYTATCGKKLIYWYGGTSKFSSLNYCSWIFLKSLSCLYKVEHTNFIANYWCFQNFWLQFRKNCGATWRKWELCSASERVFPCEMFPCEKAENCIEIDG